MEKLSKFVITSLLLFLPLVAQGVSFNVVINEIAWMGTRNSANDEWLELYNPSSQEINLDGWILRAEDGSPEINLTGIIPASNFYLLERTDDETVPGISADLIYKGALGNNGEVLKLYDNSGNLIDEVNCADGWFSGDNATKQTMERTISDDWQTSAEPGGTPKNENSKQKMVSNEQAENKGLATETLEEEANLPEKSLPEDKVEVRPRPYYPEGIIFNEILASAEGADEKNEWLEIKNTNDYEVNLSDWKIQDTTGSTNTYTFPEGTKISALGFLVLKRPETKITLNNDGDGLALINPNGEIIDSINFGKSSLGQSYNRTLSGWSWSNILTPGKENIISQKPATSAGSAEVKPQTNEEQKEETAIKNQRPGSLSLSEKSSRIQPLFFGLIVALFSGIVFLVFLTKLNFCDKLT